MRAQENKVRTFTGWNEVTGRVKTSVDMPVLSKAGSKPTAITASPNLFVLGQAPIAKKTAIDFVALGNMSVTAGQKIKIVWHMAMKHVIVSHKTEPRAMYRKDIGWIGFSWGITGDTRLIAGTVLKLTGWGKFDSDYVISQATHTLSRDSGYRTSVDLVKSLDY